LSLPFRPALFDLTMNFNLLELVSSPTFMVQELRRVSKVAADIILTSPYWWEEDETHTNEWLGGQKDCTTVDALKTLFEQLGVSLVVEQAEVPWILRYNSRAFMSFISSVMIGRVAR